MIRFCFGVFCLFSLCLKPVFALERVSVSHDSDQSNAISLDASISGDGRYVVFGSEADNLVNNDTNTVRDIFVYDTLVDTIERVSVSSSGQQSDLGSYYSSISSDGRYVTFSSRATNLVNNFNSSGMNLYLHDRQNRITSLISVQDPTIDTPPGDHAVESIFSPDGRYIAFASDFGNLTNDDTTLGIWCDPHDCSYYQYTDIFIYDSVTSVTELVSKSTSGHNGEGYSYSPSLSAAGRIVVFQSEADLVIPTSGVENRIFYRNLLTGETKPAANSNFSNVGINPSISADGNFIVYETSQIHLYDVKTETSKIVNIGNSGAGDVNPDISADGEYIVFSTGASNLVDTDTNGFYDVFVYHRETGETRLVSVNRAGEQGNANSFDARISEDGNFISFSSAATNLVDDDTNQENDIFLAQNPFTNTIEVVGRPVIDQSSETGLFIWKNTAGHTFLKVVAGDAAQNGQITNFSGSLLSEDLISSLAEISIESSAVNSPDSLTQIDSRRVDFDLNVLSPYKDEFSFVADETKALCVLLDNYAGNLYLGPDKVVVNPPYDIHRQTTCDASTVPIVGAPVIDKNHDHGIFIWKVGPQFYKASVVSANGFSIVDIDVDSEQPLTNFSPIGLEANDIVNVSTAEIALSLRIAASAKDGFKFKALNSSNTCLSNSSGFPIYVGPLRAKYGSAVNLDTLKMCQ